MLVNSLKRAGTSERGCMYRFSLETLGGLNPQMCAAKRSFLGYQSSAVFEIARDSKTWTATMLPRLWPNMSHLTHFGKRLLLHRQYWHFFLGFVDWNHGPPRSGVRVYVSLGRVSNSKLGWKDSELKLLFYPFLHQRGFWSKHLAGVTFTVLVTFI